MNSYLKMLLIAILAMLLVVACGDKKDAPDMDDDKPNVEREDKDLPTKFSGSGELKELLEEYEEIMDEYVEVMKSKDYEKASEFAVKASEWAQKWEVATKDMNMTEIQEFWEEFQRLSEKYTDIFAEFENQ
ncbi:MAG: hypothetical protein JW866_06755 [Ignavibacteriales bacterium]|nr:hypothetical protein [Ignavibacteriales bacterium]